ncbi:hypothetical protein [Pseudoalteromonas sp. S16_S37]|uniref:hypothetical protein n=1 Tax=Pseudoalteromonas sp. S16_S37 TaxID=2720228 RepID=UPI001680EF9A|nr:hypothetical protein [Pseudoalteromonas sp. S16_S37]MBD1582779.1 hypothetical protein [Pseudoalteromonas sp. S16_S37]
MANAKSIELQHEPQLSVHHNHIPKGLLEIRQMRGKPKNTPEYVWNNLLSIKERSLLCYVAKLGRFDSDKNWCDFTIDEAHELRNALMFINGTVLSFIDANALTPEKWFQGAKPNEPKYQEGSVVSITPIQQQID